MVGVMADLHFAPTYNAAQNLVKEGKLAKHIAITGNTAIDAMNYTIDRHIHHLSYKNIKIKTLFYSQHIDVKI